MENRGTTFSHRGLLWFHVRENAGGIGENVFYLAFMLES